jgi:hypothetical protein
MNPLQDLKDITIPAQIENWPPAYGWWLLIGLLSITIYILMRWLLKARQWRLAKRQSLQAIQKMDVTQANAPSELNQLLKRVAMHYFPQQNLQSIYGEQWKTFLLSTLPEKKATLLDKTYDQMLTTLYRQHTAAPSKHKDYQQACEKWIRVALPPNKRTLKKLEQQDA